MAARAAYIRKLIIKEHTGCAECFHTGAKRINTIVYGRMIIAAATAVVEVVYNTYIYINIYSRLTPSACRLPPLYLRIITTNNKILLLHHVYVHARYYYLCRPYAECVHFYLRPRYISMRTAAFHAQQSKQLFGGRPFPTVDDER